MNSASTVQVQTSPAPVWKWWQQVAFVLAICWGLTWVFDAAQPRHPIREAIGGLITSAGRIAALLVPFMILDEPPHVQHYAIGPDGSAAGGTQNHEFVEPLAASESVKDAAK